MTRFTAGGWPPDVPPFTPPYPSPYPPSRPPVYPPVPMVYERPAMGDDLADRLLDRRIVMVFGRLDTRAATDAAARLMLLDGSGDDPISLILSCPDGDLDAAVALADTVELVGVELQAVCSGTLGGCAVLPFGLGTRRIANPHATFRLVEPSIETHGLASTVAREAEHHAAAVASLYDRLARATGQPAATIAADFGARRFLDADQARAYGLVDEIGRTRHLSAV